MYKSLISVIVPCYNQAQYLDECLQSVLDQTYPNWECIIVNDGSPDHTEEVAQNWVAKDVRFKYFYKENGGLSSARNYGIERAEGEWILPLDADDYISNNYLELAEKHFSDDEVKVIYCNAWKFGYINEDWNLNSFSLKNLALGNVIFCSAFFRKLDWERIGGYDENLKLGYEDWEFWINILKDSGVIIQLETVGFFYRIKEVSMLATLKEIGETTTLQYMEKKHYDFFTEHLGTLHSLYRENEQNAKVLEVMNDRFFTKAVNKLYSIKENFFLRRKN